MRGCKRFWILILLLSGCGETPATEKKSGAVSVFPVLGEAFDANAAGTISGRVTWQGDSPEVPPFTVYGLPYDYSIAIDKEQPNPNRPHIGERRGVGPSVTAPLLDVVVFLRKVDLKKSKPWDHAKVQIEQRGRRLLVKQGETTGNVGWVRAGDEIVVTNNDTHFHMLRGRGANFFSMPFADQKTPGQRRLNKPGVVELSSGAFFFWMHGYLHVAEHPYYTKTDAEGRFTLEKVPAGNYEVVCWMPSWEVTQKYRDPDTGYVIQVDYRPAVEQVRAVSVDVGTRKEAAFTWTLGDFK
jgi:hypothetical protein